MRVEVQPLSPPRVGIDPLQIYPLVREMAATGARVRVPVAVTCRVLGFSEQAYYQWAQSPRSASKIEEEHLIGVLRELHEDDPEGGYRVLADDLHDLGYQISERRVWRLCHVAGIQSVIARRKRRYQRAGAPMDKLDLDVMVFPAVSDVGPADMDVNEASADLGWRNGVWVANGNLVPRHLGIPTVTVPMGTMSDIGMPVGLTFAGRSYDDNILLTFAAAFEATGNRRAMPPRTPPLP